MLLYIAILYVNIDINYHIGAFWVISNALTVDCIERNALQFFYINYFIPLLANKIPLLFLICFLLDPGK